MANNGDCQITNQLPYKRKILALLNPFGGRGLAPRIWQKAKEMFLFGHLDVTLRHTEYRNNAKEIVQHQIQIGEYDGIITISGDGLIHEIIQGIMNRPGKDWQ